VSAFRLATQHGRARFELRLRPRKAAVDVGWSHSFDACRNATRGQWIRAFSRLV